MEGVAVAEVMEAAVAEVMEAAAVVVAKAMEAETMEMEVMEVEGTFGGFEAFGRPSPYCQPTQRVHNLIQHTLNQFTILTKRDLPGCHLILSLRSTSSKEKPPMPISLISSR